jgi:hypothetical protein
MSRNQARGPTRGGGGAIGVVGPGGVKGADGKCGDGPALGAGAATGAAGAGGVRGAEAVSGDGVAPAAGGAAGVGTSAAQLAWS